MAGALTPRDPVNPAIADDPAWTAAGALTPSRFNSGVKLTGGTDKQLLERSTAADGTNGLNLTSTPTAQAIIFTLAAPGAPGSGWMWVTEVAGVVTLNIKKSDGNVASLVFG